MSDAIEDGTLLRESDVRASTRVTPASGTTALVGMILAGNLAKLHVVAEVGA